MLCVIQYFQCIDFLAWQLFCYSKLQCAPNKMSALSLSHGGIEMFDFLMVK